MFTKSARYYDKLYAWKDYVAESANVRALIEEHGRSPGNRLLDVACGTGMHLAQLSKHYDASGLDLDENLLAIARTRCPDLAFHHADMRDFDLGETFDVVTCLFSSIAYIIEYDDLVSAFRAFYRHLAPGGAAIVEGFIRPEDWKPGHIHALHVDEPDLKITRMNVSQRRDPLVHMEFHYLIGTKDGVTHETELHVSRLYSDAEFQSAFEAAGFDVKLVDEGLMTSRSLFVARKPE
ncbi:MAG: class I SAM-dependent methyltransferase [Gemmatimonadetes bacterium]|nr:class I SAM-dependent methyltransferase [Gemmatimonadota bacterium]